MYDLIVVGGGIAGLYTIYKYLELVKEKNKLIKTKNDKIQPRILLIESTSRLGGRIHTIIKENPNPNDKSKSKNKKPLVYEAGGARFSKKHKLLFELIKDFKLESKLYPLHSEKVFISSDNPTQEIKITNQFDKNLLELLTRIEEKQKHNPKSFTEEYLLSKTFSQIVNEISPKLMDDFNKFNPYYSEIYIMNARDAIINLKRDFMSNVQYYVLNGGIEVIIKKLVSIIKPKIDIILDIPLIDFNIDTIDDDSNISYNVLTKNKNFKTSKLVLAIPSKNLLELPFIQKDKQKKFSNVSLKSLVKMVSPQPLFRIYAKYKTSWLSHQVITDSPLKFIIPCDNTGLIMISYTDGLYTKFWLKLYQQSQKKLLEVLNKKVKELFPNIEIPEMEWLDANPYWESGAHYWIPRKTNIDATQLENEIRHPLNNLWIVGEAFSNHQAWIEGSLDTALKAIMLF